MKKESLSVALLVLCLASHPANASYQDGAWGLFVVLYSVPMAAIGFIVTLVLVAAKLFRRANVFAFYASVWVIAVLALSAYPLDADPLSAAIVLAGDGVLLVLILIPAYVQYVRRKKVSSFEVEPAVQGDGPTPGGPAT